MPKGLRRIHGRGDVHFITCSCYHRQPFLDTPQRRDFFLSVLEEVRQKYGFLVFGYVVMPEHLHLLIGEPESGSLSLAMQVLKQRVARKCLTKRGQNNLLSLGAIESDAFWQKRYYDFNVNSQEKHVEKLRYIHRNPVKRGLVESPDQWAWSSFRDYSSGKAGLVKIK